MTFQDKGGVQQSLFCDYKPQPGILRFRKKIFEIALCKKSADCYRTAEDESRDVDFYDALDIINQWPCITVRPNRFEGEISLYPLGADGRKESHFRMVRSTPGGPPVMSQETNLYLQLAELLAMWTRSFGFGHDWHKGALCFP